MADQNIQKRVDPESLKVKSNNYYSARYDSYCGTADELVAAGLVRPEQLPGAEGVGTTSATFYDGQRVPRTKRPKHNEKYLTIMRYGGRFRIRIGLSDEEAKTRGGAEYAKEQQQEQDCSRPDPGLEFAEYLVKKNAAALEVGEQVLACGVVAVVINGYGIYRVQRDAGAYRCSDGYRFDYEYGYRCRRTDGEEIFYRAHELRRNDGKGNISYLQLARSRRVA